MADCQSQPCKIPEAESATSSPPAASDLESWVAARQSELYLDLILGIGLMVGSVGPLLPLLYRHIGLSSDGLVPVFLARGVGGLVGSILAGLFIDQHPRHSHALLSAGILVSAIGTLTMPMATNLWHLGAAFIALDFGCGVASATNTLMIWAHHADHGGGVEEWLNALNGAFGMGTLLSPLCIAVAGLICATHEEVCMRPLCALHPHPPVTPTPHHALRLSCHRVALTVATQDAPQVVLHAMQHADCTHPWVLTASSGRAHIVPIRVPVTIACFSGPRPLRPA